MELLPDLKTLSDSELRDLIQQLVDEENEVSYRRRILHGKIDILKAELQSRLQRQVGNVFRGERRNGVRHGLVIPGRAEGASPESITTSLGNEKTDANQ